MTRAEALVANIGAMLGELRLLLPAAEIARNLPAFPQTASERIFAAVCRSWEIDRAELIGRSQSWSAVGPRQAAMRLLRDQGWSTPRIGRALGARHHTTILSGIRSFERRLENDETAARFAAAKGAL
jgi:chromosomal replication initiation ATPase DnaA